MIHGSEPIKLFTASELADMFGISERQLLDWRRLYSWPSVRVGRTIRFTATQVETILAQHTQTAPAAAADTAAGLPGQSKASAARAARAS